jgi:hypothetical protein
MKQRLHTSPDAPAYPKAIPNRAAGMNEVVVPQGTMPKQAATSTAALSGGPAWSPSSHLWLAFVRGCPTDPTVTMPARGDLTTSVAELLRYTLNFWSAVLESEEISFKQIEFRRHLMQIPDWSVLLRLHRELAALDERQCEILRRIIDEVYASEQPNFGALAAKFRSEAAH